MPVCLIDQSCDVIHGLCARGEKEYICYGLRSLGIRIIGWNNILLEYIMVSFAKYYCYKTKLGILPYQCT